MTENKRPFRREQKSRDSAGGDEDAAESYPGGEGGGGRVLRGVKIGFNSIVLFLPYESW